MLHYYVVLLVPVLWDGIQICRTLKLNAPKDLFMLQLHPQRKSQISPCAQCTIKYQDMDVSKRFCTESILQKHQTPQSDFQVNVRGSPDRFDFYCPIHDAAYLGQKDAVPWWHMRYLNVFKQFAWLMISGLRPLPKSLRNIGRIYRIYPQNRFLLVPSCNLNQKTGALWADVSTLMWLYHTLSINFPAYKRHVRKQCMKWYSKEVVAHTILVLCFCKVLWLLHHKAQADAQNKASPSIFIHCFTHRHG